jgi:hypothetical protein
VDDLLEKHIAPALEARGDPVIDWNKNNLKFKITGPMAGGDKESALNKVLEIEAADIRVPFQVYGLVQGSTIHVDGGPFVLTSDKAPECMSATYTKEGVETYNYFSCKTCGINWVCEGCKKGCHESQGHELLAHVSDHRPNYACCYCLKKNKCMIKNSKNMNK